MPTYPRVLKYSAPNGKEGGGKKYAMRHLDRQESLDGPNYPAEAQGKVTIIFFRSDMYLGQFASAILKELESSLSSLTKRKK